jgi:hypothetical protein
MRKHQQNQKPDPEEIRKNRRRNMRKKIMMWLLAIVIAMACPAFVLGDEPVGTSGGAISMPETAEGEEADPLPPDDELPWQDDTTEEFPAPEEEDDPDEELAQENAGVEAETDDDILHVIVPQRLDFVIDPFEITGRGQVYSEPHVIENRGDADVFLTFSDISVVFENEMEVEAMEIPFDEYRYAGSARKAIYLLLDFGREDIPPIVLTDETARASVSGILLRTGGSGSNICTLGLSGIVNCDANAGWRDGEVKINLNYHMEAIPAPGWDVPAAEAQAAEGPSNIAPAQSVPDMPAGPIGGAEAGLAGPTQADGASDRPDETNEGGL